jgi:type II secretion system protein C
MMRGGRYEALRLPRDNATGQLEGAGATRRSRSVAPATSTARRQPSTGQSPRGKPKSLAQLVNIKRKKDAAGEDIGYTLHPGTDSDLFEQVGLRDGDVLTRINGINTDTAASVWRGLQSPKSGEPVTLTVLRGDQEETLTFKLPE